MKKYLWSLVPFVLCGISAIVYRMADPADLRPMFLFKHQGKLNEQYSNMTLFVGIIMSVTLLLIMLIDDAVRTIGKKLEERSIRRLTRRQTPREP